MPPKERKLSTQSRRWHPRLVQSATCPVRELSSPRVDQSASWQSASWRIRELSSNLAYYVMYRTALNVELAAVRVMVRMMMLMMMMMMMMMMVII